MVSVADKPVLELTVEQWEAWLASTDDVVGVRLKLRKKTSSAPGMTWSEALDDDYTLIAFQPRRRNSPWSQVNREHVARLVAEGRMQPAGLAEVERAKADGRWDAAYRQRDAVAPDDLQAALDADPAAAAFFAGLTKTERFRVFFRLASIKTPAVRAARVRDVVEKAARGEQHYR